MSLSVTFIRHGRSEANEAGLWQGYGDSELSEVGLEQAAALGNRLAEAGFDLVIASDLKRAVQTAEALRVPFEVSPDWRELFIGLWEDRTFLEVDREHPGFWQKAVDQGDLRFGETGEDFRGFTSRVEAAFDDLVTRVGEGRVAVVTHGGVIDAIVARYLGRIPGRATFPIVTNTSLTVVDDGGFRIVGDGMRLVRFNDASHLGRHPDVLDDFEYAGAPLVALMRHGVTDANLAGRIQGSSCWGLNEKGRRQAEAAAAWYGSVDRVISSPLSRALETARHFGVPVEENPDLAEMAFGEWEGQIVRDLVAAGDELAVKVFEENMDLPRGGHGETMADLMERTARFLRCLELDAGLRTLVVSHGAAIRAMVAGAIGCRADLAEVMGVPSNASISHLALGESGPMLVDYSIAPHLQPPI